MEREHVNAIISLTRTDDWKKVEEYLQMAKAGMQASLSFIDCTNANEIARTQGMIQAIGLVLGLEAEAHSHNSEEQS